MTRFSSLFALLFLNACDFLRNERNRHLRQHRAPGAIAVTRFSGDVYVINVGEARTYEFVRGSYDFDAYCGNGAWGNDLCGLEKASSRVPTTSTARTSM